MVEASGSGHWYGLGRYERGDRRDQRLWSIGLMANAWMRRIIMRLLSRKRELIVYFLYICLMYDTGR